MGTKANPGDEIYSPYFDKWLRITAILPDGRFVFWDIHRNPHISQTKIDWYEQRDLVRSRE